MPKLFVFTLLFSFFEFSSFAHAQIPRLPNNPISPTSLNECQKTSNEYSNLWNSLWKEQRRLDKKELPLFKAKNWEGMRRLKNKKVELKYRRNEISKQKKQAWDKCSAQVYAYQKNQQARKEIGTRKFETQESIKRRDIANVNSKSALDDSENPRQLQLIKNAGGSLGASAFSSYLSLPHMNPALKKFYNSYRLLQFIGNNRNTGSTSGSGLERNTTMLRLALGKAGSWNRLQRSIVKASINLIFDTNKKALADFKAEVRDFDLGRQQSQQFTSNILRTGTYNHSYSDELKSILNENSSDQVLSTILTIMKLVAAMKNERSVEYDAVVIQVKRTKKQVVTTKKRIKPRTVQNAPKSNVSDYESQKYSRNDPYCVDMRNSIKGGADFDNAYGSSPESRAALKKLRRIYSQNCY